MARGGTGRAYGRDAPSGGTKRVSTKRRIPCLAERGRDTTGLASPPSNRATPETGMRLRGYRPFIPRPAPPPPPVRNPTHARGGNPGLHDLLRGLSRRRARSRQARTALSRRRAACRRDSHALRSLPGRRLDRGRAHPVPSRRTPSREREGESEPSSAKVLRTPRAERREPGAEMLAPS